MIYIIVTGRIVQGDSCKASAKGAGATRRPGKPQKKRRSPEAVPLEDAGERGVYSMTTSAVSVTTETKLLPGQTFKALPSAAKKSRGES